MLKHGNEGLTPRQIADRKYREANKEKLAAYRMKIKLENPDKYKETNKASRERYAKSEKGRSTKNLWQRAKRYGITKEQVEYMLSFPCAICGNPSEHIDHCHATEQVRAALCGHCNKGLGLFFDSPILLEAAANYIKEHRSVNEETQKQEQPGLQGSHPSEALRLAAKLAWFEHEADVCEQAAEWTLGPAYCGTDGTCESCT